MRDEPIHANKNRLLQRAACPANRKLFDATRRATFLEWFAATCNARLAAAKAGVAYQTVFKHRARDAGFAAAWDEALAQGYARLEAEVLAAALAPCPAAEDGAAPGGDAGAAPDGNNGGQVMTLRQAQGEREGDVAAQPFATIEQKLAILREYRRGFGAGRRAAPAVRLASDEEVGAALVKRLRSFAMRVRDEAK